MGASKYICIYNDMIFPFNDKKEIATSIMGYKLIKKDNGKWDIIINGKEVAHYSEEFTKEEIEKNFFSTFFQKFTFANLHFYNLN